MVSDFSREFARKHLETDVTVGAARLMKNLDASLQEVRDVLEGVIRVADRKTVEFDRARALWAKLEVK